MRRSPRSSRFACCLVLGQLLACSDGDEVAGADASSGGASSTGTTIENPCGALDSSYGESDAAELFGAEDIPAFDLYLPEESWQWLNDNAVEEQYVEAQACFNGKAIGLVGLRFKGSYGSLYSCFDAGENTCRKLGMKVKFDEYVEDQRFYGLKRLNFQGYHYDDTYLKERLAYDLYREMGLVAPRASWAVLRVNGEAQGLFGMVEQLDGRFTKNRWPDNGDGNLFKEVWPGDDDDASLTAGLETNEDAGDISAMKAFSSALNAASDDELRDTLGSFLELEYLARFMAVDDAVAGFDGVTTFYTDGSADDAGNHNFFLYQEADTHFTIIPWDLESTMSLASGYGNVPPWQTTPEDCSMTYPVWDGQSRVMAPGCDRVFQALNSDLTDYREAAQELLDGPFALDHMLERIDTLAAFVREQAIADPHGPGEAAFESGIGFLRQGIVQLRARVSHLMSGEPTVPVVLDAAQVNGFETADDYGLTAGTTLLSNANTMASVAVNATDPLVGNQSIRYSFSFANETTAWNQWTFYAIPFAVVPADLSSLTGIRVTLRSNAPRALRFELKSPNNSRASEGIQLGWDLSVSTEPEVFEVELANAVVPTWATDPRDSLETILQTVTALSFHPACNGRDAEGQLPEGVTDDGWLDIDAIEVF